MFASPTEELLKQWERSGSCFMFYSPAEIHNYHVWRTEQRRRSKQKFSFLNSKHELGENQVFSVSVSVDI